MRTVQALDRGLRILEFLSARDQPVGVTELAQKLKVDKSTAHRLLGTLLERKFVKQDEHRRYHLSYKPIQIGILQLNRIELRVRARPFLGDLVARTGETAHLAMRIQDRVIYVDREESPNMVTVATHVGGEAPPHCTATGKALMAFLPPAEQDRVLRDLPLERYTPRTMTDLYVLRNHLQDVRQRGYATDDEERFLGVRCIAAPVRDYRGQVVASIGISGPAHRLTLEHLQNLHPIVVEIAAALSKANGYLEPATVPAGGNRR